MKGPVPDMGIPLSSGQADAEVDSPGPGVDLYWLPLGAGGHSVRWNGRAYEAACAMVARRAAVDLYHSALVVSLPPDTWVIEMTPVWSTSGDDRGVVAEGAVGTRWAGRSRFFRYEVHCWRGGSIADIEQAVASPTRLSSDEAACRRLLALIPSIPTPVWGRDELETGEMWNSNSVTAWALARSGLDPLATLPPRGGRAPGWNAGLVAERRQRAAQPFGGPHLSAPIGARRLS
ncbi:MAG: hypothetical protein QOE24_2906 [Frankiales bacterium]|nr:hypothetical protein [Frankiales bacterium]